jgi:hypothetical protein
VAGTAASLPGVDRKGQVGIIGGGKSRPTGRIDIALMQSLSRQGEVNALVENYGQVVVDECHHVGAVSFDAILRSAKARYVLGLTATPIRRDGQQPIIFMQCGPTRHTAARAEGAPKTWRWCHDHLPNPSSWPPKRASRTCSGNSRQTSAHAAIAEEVVGAYSRGRKILVLTERTEHLDALGAALEGRCPAVHAARADVDPKQRQR